MAVLRIEVKVDDQLIEVLELNLNDGHPRDHVFRFWAFLEIVHARMNNWSYQKFFKRG